MDNITHGQHSRELLLLVYDFPGMSAVAGIHSASLTPLVASVPAACACPNVSAVAGVPSVANSLADASIPADVACL
jgi:hypothetical protein